MTEFEIIKDSGSLWLLRKVGTDKYSVVSYDRSKGQVYSYMPTDHPAGGGLWFGRMNDSGVAYVANFRYSKSYATKMFYKKNFKELWEL